MKSITFVLFALALIVVAVVAEEACDCVPDAGCREIGCRCWHEKAEYQPRLVPQQRVVAGCPACPPVGHCPADLVRLACSENQQCTAEDLETYVLA